MNTSFKRMGSADHPNFRGRPLLDFLLPIVVWGLVVLVFRNIKYIPLDFIEHNAIVVRYAAKFLMTIALPIALIYFLKRKEVLDGVHFSNFSNAFRLSIRAYGFCGPAGISFLIISYLGLTFKDWSGSFILSTFYLLALLLVIYFNRNLSIKNDFVKGRNHIPYLVVGSIITILCGLFLYDSIPLIPRVLYYIFIVGFGEELLFRGYIQSSFNKFFGKPYSFLGLHFGWGLLVASFLFGLMHSLVNAPPIWSWALFTFIMGLIMGVIREKEGSIFSAIMLHALMDMPLAFLPYFSS